MFDLTLEGWRRLGAGAGGGGGGCSPEFEGILRVKSACTNPLHRPAVQPPDQSPPGRTQSTHLEPEPETEPETETETEPGPDRKDKNSTQLNNAPTQNAGHNCENVNRNNLKAPPILLTCIGRMKPAMARHRQNLFAVFNYCDCQTQWDAPSDRYRLSFFVFFVFSYF